MSKRVIRAVALGAVVLIVGVGAYAVAGGDARNFRGSPMIGLEENPDVSTVGRGSFTARLSSDGTRLSYELRYSNLEAPITQSHIHFAKPGVNGGISIWLCQTPGVTPPSGSTADPPTCPAGTSGTVTGTVDATDVVGPVAPVNQGIEPGAFGEIIAAMRAGRTYANVHSTKFPGGEIRAQIKARSGDN